MPNESPKLAELLDMTVLVLTSFDPSHPQYQRKEAEKPTAHCQLLRFHQDVSGCAVRVQDKKRPGKCDLEIAKHELADLAVDAARGGFLGQTGILISVAERARHAELAQAALRSFAETRAVPLDLPRPDDEWLSVWAGHSGDWVIVLCDPNFSQDGRRNLEAALVKEQFLSVETHWHKVLSRVADYDQARAKAEDAQWVRELRLTLAKGPQPGAIRRRAVAPNSAIHHQVEQLGELTKYVAVLLYSLEGLSADVEDDTQRLLHPVQKLIAGSRHGETQKIVGWIERDQKLLMQLLQAAEWRAEQDQKRALDQIQILGIVVTVVGLSLAIAQLWAASLITEEESRSLAIFFGLLAPPLFICLATVFLMWVTEEVWRPKLEAICTSVREFLERVWNGRGSPSVTKASEVDQSRKDELGG